MLPSINCEVKHSAQKVSLAEKNKDVEGQGDQLLILLIHLINIHKVLRQKQPILHSTERLHKNLKETPVVTYRRSPNLPDLLVRAKL